MPLLHEKQNPAQEILCRLGGVRLAYAQRALGRRWEGGRLHRKSCVDRHRKSCVGPAQEILCRASTGNPVTSLKGLVGKRYSMIVKQCDC